MKQCMKGVGLAVLLLPMAVSAEVLDIEGVAKAFFPSQDIDTTLSTEQIKHFNYIVPDRKPPNPPTGDQHSASINPYGLAGNGRP